MEMHSIDPADPSKVGTCRNQLHGSHLSVAIEVELMLLCGRSTNHCLHQERPVHGFKYTHVQVAADAQVAACVDAGLLLAAGCGCAFAMTSDCMCCCLLAVRVRLQGLTPEEIDAYVRKQEAARQEREEQ
jgi:hypothetical protein